jgi:hypothetical protein
MKELLFLILLGAWTTAPLVAIWLYMEGRKQ